MQTTPRLGLRVPDGTIDLPDVPLWMLRIAQDIESSLQVGLTADRPAAGKAGRHYYATDGKVEYVDTGATWEPVAVPPRRVLTTLPAAGAYAGEEVYLSVTNAALPGGPERWLLRYDDTRSGSYKWEVISAKPLVASNNTTGSANNPTSGPWIQDARAGFPLTVPVKGVYDITFRQQACVSGPIGVRGYSAVMVGAGGLVYNGSHDVLIQNALANSAVPWENGYAAGPPIDITSAGAAVYVADIVDAGGLLTIQRRTLRAAPRWLGA
jgi:hypothetical protein